MKKAPPSGGAKDGEKADFTGEAPSTEGLLLSFYRSIDYLMVALLKVMAPF